MLIRIRSTAYPGLSDGVKGCYSLSCESRKAMDVLYRTSCFRFGWPTIMTEIKTKNGWETVDRQERSVTSRMTTRARKEWVRSVYEKIKSQM